MALAEDRNRRADAPDKGNRCYAEPAPRQRDLAYQADFCYSKGFSSCSVFLAWAARNAAEPAYVTEAAQRAWGSGIAAPEGETRATDLDSDAAEGDVQAEPTPDGGLFGPPDSGEAGDGGKSGSESLDWVSASAWADAPWDERAEVEADELAAIEELEPADGEAEDGEDDSEPGDGEEATTAPKVPAALPMRRRRRPQRPIRTRGSGEWFYADPLDHEPLVRRRYSVAPPILLGVLGLLVVALVIFLLPTLLSGGGDSQTGAAPSASPRTTISPTVTRAPVVAATAGASVAPSPDASSKIRTYKVKRGDTLSGIAEKFGVKPIHLQCMNRILKASIVVLGARYQIPPEGFSCPRGWRTATPAP